MKELCKSYITKWKSYVSVIYMKTETIWLLDYHWMKWRTCSEIFNEKRMDIQITGSWLDDMEIPCTMKRHWKILITESSLNDMKNSPDPVMICCLKNIDDLYIISGEARPTIWSRCVNILVFIDCENKQFLEPETIWHGKPDFNLA